MFVALMLSSLLALQDAEPGKTDPRREGPKAAARSSGRGISFHLGPDGKVELTIRETHPSTGEQTSKTYRADSLEEFRKTYPDVAKEYRIERFAESPDGGFLKSWADWKRELESDRFWDDRFSSIFSPWMPLWPLDRMVRPATFGIQIGPVGEAMAAQLELREGEGLLIRDVAENTPAAKAGLRRHDVILKLDAAPVGDAQSFRHELRQRLPKGFELEIVRQGKKQAIRVAAEKF